MLMHKGKHASSSEKLRGFFAAATDGRRCFLEGWHFQNLWEQRG